MSDLSEAYGAEVPEATQSIWDLFQATVEKCPDNLALACVHQKADLFGIQSVPLNDDDYRQKPYLRWTYRQLRDAIFRAAAGLREAGVEPGTTIFTFLPNGAEYVCTAWAANELGCILVPLSPRNLANRTEVAHMIRTAMSVAPDKTPTVLVQTDDLAKSVEELGLLSGGVKVVISGSGANPNWRSFEQVMSDGVSPTRVAVANSSHKVIDGLVLFTSGTTSLPKGTLKQFPMFASALQPLLLYPPPDCIGTGSVFCGVLPNNHAMGHLTLVMISILGGTLVYAGTGFQADGMFDTMHREKVTHTALVPTMVHALAGLKATAGYRLEHLVSVMFGGAVLSPDMIRTAIEELGSKGAENAFGMTEGFWIRSNNQRDVAAIIDGDEISAGKVSPGMGLRISDPETNRPVPRNMLGELQASAPALGYYIGDVASDSFYNDQHGRLWFKTGDQARMDAQGRIFITGRYKDMIIRGGENMSPTAIESAISKDPVLKAMNPQVVGAKDIIAGEVPVAVLLGNVDGKIKDAVQESVIKNMGIIYVPEDVISLQTLGISDYPRTMAGKIQKTKLADLVKQYRSRVNSAFEPLHQSQLAVEVREIWAKAVGLESSRIQLDAPIGDFADSITVMRVRDMIKRKTGKLLSLVDMSKAETISGQIELLQNRSGTQVKTIAKRVLRVGPPEGGDMQHLVESPDILYSTKKLITRTLSPYGLDWDDVEDVIPAYDFINVMAETHVFDSWGLKISMLTTKANKAQLRAAIEKTLMNNRILASFFVTDPEKLKSHDALHVAVRQNKKLFDLVIKDGRSLESLDDLKRLVQDHRDYARFPGPLMRTILYDINETGTTGLLMTINHAVVDATTGLMFAADLEKALSKTSGKLEDHVDYKLWADSYHNLRTSAGGRAAARWHIQRLGGLEAHKKALWPPYTMPKNSADALVEDDGPDVLEHSFDAPGIHEFRKLHPRLSATIILKTALVLTNIHRTEHTHALFVNLEAARTTFPFLSKTLEATGQFEATDVSGPTFQAVVNLVEFRANETVVSMIARLQDEQSNLTKHASAPMREIMAGLGDAGFMVPEIVGRQSFNWVPGMGATGTKPYQNFENLDLVSRPRQGLLLNAGLGGPEQNTFLINLRGTGLDRDGYKKVAGDLEHITLWLLKKENWDSAVGGYVAALTGASNGHATS